MSESWQETERTPRECRGGLRLCVCLSLASPCGLIRDQALDLHNPAGSFSEPLHLSSECKKGAIRFNDDGGSRSNSVADRARRREREQGLQFLPAVTLTVGVAQDGGQSETGKGFGALVVVGISPPDPLPRRA